jgi:hypothetical protein
MWDEIKGIKIFEEKGKNVGMPQENYIMVIRVDEVEFLTVPDAEKLGMALLDWAELMRIGNHYPKGQY